MRNARADVGSASDKVYTPRKNRVHALVAVIHSTSKHGRWGQVFFLFGRLNARATNLLAERSERSSLNKQQQKTRCNHKDQPHSSSSAAAVAASTTAPYGRHTPHLIQLVFRDVHQHRRVGMSGELQRARELRQAVGTLPHALRARSHVVVGEPQPRRQTGRV